MASGSSSRNNSGSKGFDFGTDDILCSYEDYANNQEPSHSDPVAGSAASNELHKSRLARSFPPAAYTPSGESNSQDVISAVEKSMKKYTGNLMRFLEGISSRLSQLELYCYNLDKSIGEMRLDLNRNHEEADSKLKSLEKHFQEVHRSVQILRDKQELADTQKELAKIQLSQKPSSLSSSDTHSQQTEEKPTPPLPSPVPQNTQNTPEIHAHHLALALPHQVHPQHASSPPQMPPQAIQQAPPTYYLLPPHQPSQGQYMPSDSYKTPPQQASQVHTNQASQIQILPQYQQQWAPQAPVQGQNRPPPTTVYSSYLPNQPINPNPHETLPTSMSMQVPYGYNGPSRPPQQLKASFDGYTSAAPHPGNTYIMYETEGGRVQHTPQPPPHYQQNSYPQTPQPNLSSNLVVRPTQQLTRNHPYSELIEKLMSMGYRGDHVLSIIQRLEESGQPVDFNSVLDRLNGHTSVSGSQRGWSG